MLLKQQKKAGGLCFWVSLTNTHLLAFSDILHSPHQVDTSWRKRLSTDKLAASRTSEKVITLSGKKTWCYGWVSHTQIINEPEADKIHSLVKHHEVPRRTPTWLREFVHIVIYSGSNRFLSKYFILQIYLGRETRLNALGTSEKITSVWLFLLITSTKQKLDVSTSLLIVKRYRQNLCRFLITREFSSAKVEVWLAATRSNSSPTVQRKSL